jgi:Holliday junction resolvase RusA-like endonuclease
VRATLVIDGAAAGKARHRFNRQTGRAFTPRQTVVAENRVVHAWQQAGCPRFGDGPLRASIVVITSRPKTHYTSRGELSSAGRRAPHPTRKPDLDNIAKLLLDGLNKLAYNDDCQIVELSVVRRWARIGEVDVTLLTIAQIPCAAETGRIAA